MRPIASKVKIEREVELPIGGLEESENPPAAATGPFGPIFHEHRHDAPGAVKRLLEERSGEAVAALHHPDIGDIDLVWGSAGSGRGDGSGLAKIEKWHPEVLSDLQGPLSAMKVVSRTANRVRMESDTHQAVVRLDHDGKAKKWLLTEFGKRGSAIPERTTDIPQGNADRMANSPVAGRAEGDMGAPAPKVQGKSVIEPHTGAMTGGRGSAIPKRTLDELKIICLLIT